MAGPTSGTRRTGFDHFGKSQRTIYKPLPGIRLKRLDFTLAKYVSGELEPPMHVLAAHLNYRDLNPHDLRSPKVA